MRMKNEWMDVSRSEVLEAFPWPAIMLDEGGRIMSVSRVPPGFDRAAFASCPLLADAAPDYWQALQDAGDGPCERYKDISRRVAGRAVHERLWFSRVRDGIVLFIEDRGDEVIASQAELQRDRLAALGFMVAGVCHEISNPLTAVQSMMQMLLGRSDVGADALHKGLRIVSDNVRRVMEISRRLVDFSRVAEEPRTAIEIDAAVIEAVVLLRQGLHTGDISVEHFPELGAAVVGNAGQLQEVIYNILINAAHAMGCGGRIFVTTCTTEARRVTVRVSDTGPGIPDDVLPRIFDPFFTTKPSGQGTGLGLAIAYELVREHGGDLRAFNNPQGGATFEIDLPAHFRRSAHDK
jgi:signal transduction histidine kinase